MTVYFSMEMLLQGARLFSLLFNHTWAHTHTHALVTVIDVTKIPSTNYTSLQKRDNRIQKEECHDMTGCKQGVGCFPVVSHNGVSGQRRLKYFGIQVDFKRSIENISVFMWI